MEHVITVTNILRLRCCVLYLLIHVLYLIPERCTPCDEYTHRGCVMRRALSVNLNTFGNILHNVHVMFYVGTPFRSLRKCNQYASTYIITKRCTIKKTYGKIQFMCVHVCNATLYTYTREQGTTYESHTSVALFTCIHTFPGRRIRVYERKQPTQKNEIIVV